MARITQPLGTLNNLLEMHNLFWKTCVDAGKKPGAATPSSLLSHQE